MKKAKLSNIRDNRVNVKRRKWLEYLLIWLVMLSLTGGQALILNEYFDLSEVPVSFILANIGYWALLSSVFCLIAWAIQRRTHDRPMLTLSEATKRVAEGDFSVHISPLRKDGKKDYVEVMFDDFNKMVEELASIEKLTSDFGVNVSHEIKTPLAVIQNYASALQKKGTTELQREEYTDTIISASQKLNALVSNVLKLSKLENKKINALPEKFDLTRQLSECALIFENLFEQKGINFSLTFEDKVIINSDQSILEMVWNNLISNALKFTDKGGTVFIHQTSEREIITVSISDTGCGMDENALEHIFDKFYQADASHSKEGNGLGLAIVHRAVTLLGGSISVISQVGKGSTFTVKINQN